MCFFTPETIKRRHLEFPCSVSTGPQCYKIKANVGEGLVHGIRFLCGAKKASSDGSSPGNVGQRDVLRGPRIFIFLMVLSVFDSRFGPGGCLVAWDPPLQCITLHYITVCGRCAYIFESLRTWLEIHSPNLSLVTSVKL